MDTTQGPVQIQLSADEALVLFEWLSKTEDDDALEPLIEHWSEQLVLWSILGQLQTSLIAPLDPNYSIILDQARERLVADIDPEDRKRVK